MTGNPENNSDLPFLHLALPVMDEPDLLPRLLGCLATQTYRRFRLHICVNQPESWRDDPEKATSCENNGATLLMLEEWEGCETVVIDRSTRGLGWIGKQHGVGYARKTLMDHINREATPDDVIVSLDADSVFSENYLLSIALNFSAHPGAVALAVPYFHKTGQDDVANRAMLQYEIYIRHYILNLDRIGSPYAFTQ
ncbi:MAG: hypothetical protein WCK34_14800 [Bacteroidota bacterium]